MSTALAPRDAERLADLEVTIAQGLTTFVEVGRALTEIRENRLYRERYATFEGYCEAQWQMSSSRARQLIGAASIVTGLESVTNVTPANEAQVRPLAALPPETQREVWKEAVETAPEGKAPTAAHVAATVERITKPLFADPPKASTPVIPLHGQRPRTIAQEARDFIREEEKSGFSIVMGFITQPTDIVLTREQVAEFFADPLFDPVVLPRVDRMSRNFEVIRSHRFNTGGKNVGA